MNLLRVNGSTSNIIRVRIRDLSDPYLGKVGLTFESVGLIIGTIAHNEATATAYTGGNLETIATLGTYAAPTTGKCRFKEVDGTNFPGLYEIQLADARFAVAGAKSLLVSVIGVADMGQQLFEIDLAGTVLSVASVTGSVGSVATGGIAAASFAADAVSAASVSAAAVTKIQTGLATATVLNTVGEMLDSEVADIKAVTDKLDTTVELDGAVYRFTENALEQSLKAIGSSLVGAGGSIGSIPADFPRA